VIIGAVLRRCLGDHCQGSPSTEQQTRTLTDSRRDCETPSHWQTGYGFPDYGLELEVVSFLMITTKSFDRFDCALIVRLLFFHRSFFWGEKKRSR
jgi:hypothetical protein